MITFATRKGQGKRRSEDAVLANGCVWADTEGSFPLQYCEYVCVADGVGGQAAGEIASQFVLSELINCRTDALEQDLRSINDRLIEQGRQNPSRTGMATTLTGFYLAPEQSILIHVGNTRAYALQGRYLKQITGDHTVYNWLRSMGRFEEAEACNRSEITSCFGGDSIRLLDKLLITEIPTPSTILLTSDGIHDCVSLDDLEYCLTADLADLERCRMLLELALEAGSRDDLTAILIRRE